MNHLVALSGGKDSTALAMRLNELHPNKYQFFCTPTGDELPCMKKHWKKLEILLKQKITYVYHPDFPNIYSLIEHFKALPNYRQRWCTRILKIEASQIFYHQNEPAIIYVGLRYDEQEREGNTKILGDIKQEYPLQEWKWGLKEVWDYLNKKQITIPRRTDCGMCFYQRIGEWWMLWNEYPKRFQKYINIENKYEHTFMSPGKHKIWPHKLEDLKIEFEKGRKPQEIKKQIRNKNIPCLLCNI